MLYTFYPVSPGGVRLQNLSAISKLDTDANEKHQYSEFSDVSCVCVFSCYFITCVNWFLYSLEYNI